MARAKSVSTEELVKQNIRGEKPQKPTGPVCPKCGEQKGWSGPHYQQGRRVKVKVVASPTRFRDEVVESTESLQYTCNGCGYTRHEACNDNLTAK